jgi:hypothetical protein
MLMCVTPRGIHSREVATTDPALVRSSQQENIFRAASEITSPEERR